MESLMNRLQHERIVIKIRLSSAISLFTMWALMFIFTRIKHQTLNELKVRSDLPLNMHMSYMISYLFIH